MTRDMAPMLPADHSPVLERMTLPIFVVAIAKNGVRATVTKCMHVHPSGYSWEPVSAERIFPPKPRQQGFFCVPCGLFLGVSE